MKTYKSKAKKQLLIGIIIIVGCILCYVLITLFQNEKMTFDGMYSVKVFVSKQKIGDYTDYHVKFVNDDKDIDLSYDLTSSDYYNCFNESKNEIIDVPVFKMEDGQFFIPPTKEKCSEADASLYYSNLNNKKYVLPIYAIGIIIGLSFLLMAYKSLKKEKKPQVRTVQTGIFDDIPTNNNENSDSEDVMDFFEEQRGKEIYRKTKARFYAEEYPLATEYPSVIKGDGTLKRGADRIAETAELNRAKKEILSEKFGFSQGEKKGVGDILAYDKNKKKK